ncbi:uncharacterized protein PpBr36_05834 [Pyricularia pennisetigena]|uniref:uncharacterized protein n=1 Tax=Pyricularia pennisetigena TaxID=1578925 RepID=UPI0011504699|nr:uncharacterized protein PpBr36_05834 [Pyricularia pennisetigena]TLS22592.1 hypothetical protein PpBr36_05834 [Pyricularia pennisetigena]
MRSVPRSRSGWVPCSSRCCCCCCHLSASSSRPPAEGLGAADIDWALHPGGRAIVAGVQSSLNLTDYQLRTTNQIYRTRDNSFQLGRFGRS